MAAEKKASFILYHDHFELFKRLNQNQRGNLVTAIFAFECGEDLPKLDDLTDMAFISIKQDLVRNGKSYEERCRQNKENGKKGGRPSKKTKKTERFSEKPNGFFQNPNDNEDDNPQIGERSGRQAGNAMPSETDLKQLEVLRNQ